MDKTEKIKKIAEVMKNYRIKGGKSAANIAKELNLTRQAFYGYENGKQPIQIALWLDWCDALELKPRSVIEKCHEALTGQRRPHLSKRQLEIREAKKILAAGNTPLRS